MKSTPPPTPLSPTTPVVVEVVVDFLDFFGFRPALDGFISISPGGCPPNNGVPEGRTLPVKAGRGGGAAAGAG